MTRTNLDGEIAESRSKETGNHVKRVAEYSYLLAKKYGLPEVECELLRHAAPMHDIGKVAIPDAILNKPARLTPEERMVMERHAEIGYRVMSGSTREILNAAAVIAGNHHEKWDGTGYPAKLKETQIPLYGRIVSVADVFDALITPRVYKEAWPIEKITAYFEAEKGKHFDPQLVDILLDKKDEFLEIFMRHSDLDQELH